MKDEGMGSTWITIVLVTVVAILVFLVFFGTKKSGPEDQDLPILEKQAEAPAVEKPAETPR